MTCCKQKGGFQNKTLTGLNNGEIMFLRQDHKLLVVWCDCNSMPSKAQWCTMWWVLVELSFLRG